MYAETADANGTAAPTSESAIGASVVELVTPVVLVLLTMVVSTAASRCASTCSSCSINLWQGGESSRDLAWRHSAAASVSASLQSSRMSGAHGESSPPCACPC